jgi:Family of unknown function (DUF6524)
MIGRILSGFFLVRFLVATIVVFAFYNIWGMSYYHWITGPGTFNFGMVVAGLGFAGAFAFFLYSSLRAPAKVVYFFLLAFVFASVWCTCLTGFRLMIRPSAPSWLN